MPIFKYAMKRILTSPSTYVIALIFLVAPTIIFSIWRPEYSRKDWFGHDPLPALFAWSMMSGFVLSFFNAYFVGSLISKNISEEINDGSFLLIISKPLSRLRILLEKMLAISIVMITGYLLVSFVPIVSFLIPRAGDKSLFFANFWPFFWKLFAVGLLMQFFILSVFSIFAWFFSPRVITTAISMFVTFIIILNLVLQNWTGKTVYQWIMEWYVFTPLLLAIIILVPVNWKLFVKHDFA